MKQVILVLSFFATYIFTGCNKSNSIQDGPSTSGKHYQVGDFYNEKGVKGVVYKVDSTSMHGMIVSLADSGMSWCTYYPLIECYDMFNGINNMNVVKKQSGWQNIYPAFKWCDDMNSKGITGWHIPATYELQDLYTGYCALTTYPVYLYDFYRTDTVLSVPPKQKDARDAFNRTLTLNGGRAISDTCKYWSSTANNSTPCITYEMFFRNGFWNCSDRRMPYRVRAVRAF